MLSPYALATVEAVADYLQIDEIENTNLLENLINVSTGFLELVTQRRLKARDYTNYRLNGTGKDYIYYPEYPLNEITMLAIEDSTQTLIQSIDTEPESKQFLIDRFGGRVVLSNIIFANNFWAGSLNIITDFNAGFTPHCSQGTTIHTNIEDQLILDVLQQTCVHMVQYIFANSGVQDVTLRRERIGDYEYERAMTQASTLANTAFSSIPSYLAQTVLQLRRV